MDVLLTENRRLREELDDSNKEFVDLTTKAAAATRLKEKLADTETKVSPLPSQTLSCYSWSGSSE